MEKSTTNIPQLENTGIYNSLFLFTFFNIGEIMVEEIQMSTDEAIEYVRNNVQIRDILELSYNRIFAPGEVLNIIEEDEETGEGLRVSLQLTGEILNQTVEIDFNEIKDDLIEIRHIKDDVEKVIEIVE